MLFAHILTSHTGYGKRTPFVMNVYNSPMLVPLQWLVTSLTLTHILCEAYDLNLN